MQSKSSQKVITGNQKNVTSISQKFSKIKGIRYVKREKMNFRFSHPLLLKRTEDISDVFGSFFTFSSQKFSMNLITFSVVVF